MCGICGIYNPEGIAPADVDAIERMTRALSHRGPDDSGIHIEKHIALGHTRLSIVDIAGGNQPMCNETADVWTSFNGEIYNFLSLRDRLESAGHVFKTRSDTEALVHGFEQYGGELPEMLDGMFAFAAWNGRSGELLLARDRAGKKPLYYTRLGERLLFASEIKSLLLHPYVERAMEPRSLHHLLSFQHVPGDATIFKGISKLRPAEKLMVSQSGMRRSRYWLPEAVETNSKINEAEEAEKLNAVLREAVKKRLMGDVPVGAFLSGGVDSSAVAAIMAAEAGSRVYTFSIGFDQPEYDETEYARMMADRLGTDHTEFTVTGRDLMKAAPGLVWHTDEPFPDSSILPSYCLSAMTRKHVKVALSGDGGDELFGGYERYAGDAYLHRLAAVPTPVRKYLAAPACAFMSEAAAGSKASHRLSQLAAFLPMSDAERHLNWLAFFTHAEKKKLYSPDFAGAAGGAVSSEIMEEYHAAASAKGRDFTAKQLLVDFKSYLPETLMMKTDRASMAVNLEVRCPLLDTRAAEIALSLPGNVRVRGAETKSFLKKTLQGLLPAEILHRRKKGFEVPLNAWFRGPLREAVRDLLTGGTARGRGLFAHEYVERLLDEHDTCAANHGHKLWTLLNVEMWHKTFMDGPAPEGPREFF